MLDNKKIGIVVADKDEFAPFKAIVQKYGVSESMLLNKPAITFKIGRCEVTALHCGIGKVNAAAAAMHLIDKGCGIILNFGLSGGISNVSRGQLVVPESFLEHDFDLTVIGYKPCEKPGQEYIYHTDKALYELFLSKAENPAGGTAVCGDRFVSSDADRQFLSETFGAVSCDMETAAIAAVCHMAGVPYASLRRVSDDAGDDAADSYREMNTGSETLLFDTFEECLKALCETEA